VASAALGLSRRWIALVVAVVIAGAVILVVRATGESTGPCGAERVDARSPLLDPAGMVQQPDERLDTLASSVGAMAAPFGPVLGGVGYDYDQYLHLYGVTDGVLAWTKNNAPVTMLDGTDLRPLWSLQTSSKRTAWDASEDTFLLLDLAGSRPTQVSAYALATGRQRWCTEVGQAHADGDPVATSFVDDGDVLTALRSGDSITVTRLSADTGKKRWDRSLSAAGRADFLGQLTDHTALVGGIEEPALIDARPTGSGPVLTAFDTTDGETAWTWSPGADAVAHVVGVADGRVIVMARVGAGYELVALDDEDGSELWRVPTKAAAHEATLRGDLVVTKSPAGLDGYDAGSGALRWRLPTPSDRTYFPYGFTLGQMPSLDADHVLLPRTEALGVLDLRTGRQVDYPLPTDGVSTTYWPYQLLVTDQLLGVLTNTGAVVARRE
jgi:outer membrane protein assembly factor BamB